MRSIVIILAGRRTRAMGPFPICVPRLKRSNLFEDKYLQYFPPCGGDVGLAERENKATILFKKSLT